MFFLSAAKCDFGFVTVFVTQEHCINLNFVWNRSYVSINERFFFFFSISHPFHLFIVSSFSMKYVFSVHWHINKRHFLPFSFSFVKQGKAVPERDALLDQRHLENTCYVSLIASGDKEGPGCSLCPNNTHMEPFAAYAACFPAQLSVAASVLLYWRGALESGLM